jgi:carbamoyl-phosphate synthase large subunit
MLWRWMWMRSPTPPAAVVIGGIMEHIEQAGIHSGDSACSLPPSPLGRPPGHHPRLDGETGQRLQVVGLMNIQFAVKGEQVYILGSQSPRLPHRAFCVEGHGASPGQAGGAGDVGQNPGRTGLHRRSHSPTFPSKKRCCPSKSFLGTDTLWDPKCALLER